MNWKNININKNMIKADTGRAILINCPHNSRYDGYCFWHTSKLVRNGRHSASKSIGYNDEFTFKLIKYGKGKYNSRDVIDEKEIGVEEFEEMFGVVNENIVAPNNDTYLVVNEPTKVNADVEVKDELKNEQ